MTDIRELHRRALRTAQGIVRKVDAGGLGLPTPCAGWDLDRLLAHMTGQNHGFAASARGESTDPGIWADRPVGEDPAGVFDASADDVVAAFAQEGVLERRFWLPEIRDGATFPAAPAIGFHFVDSVVHGWDVARSIGLEAEFDVDVLEAALPIAEAVPGGAARSADGAAFRPEVPAGDAAGLLDRVVAVLGRSPDWAPSATRA
ncbi:TIGR03086 family metal-binding protein [Streptomyces sp. NPDC059373]